MVLHPHPGSVSDSCRYVAIAQADNSFCVFLLKLKPDKIIILTAAVAQSMVQGGKAEGSWFKPQLKAGRRGVSTPSEYCQSTHEQGIKPLNAQIGPCYELVTHPWLYWFQNPPRDPAREKVVKKKIISSMKLQMMYVYQKGFLHLNR